LSLPFVVNHSPNHAIHSEYIVTSAKTLKTELTDKLKQAALLIPKHLQYLEPELAIDSDRISTVS